MKWDAAARQKRWQTLAEDWDLIVIGGGITGAAILLEAARLELRVLLLEKRDFGWGTSSRSSKFVHGGLRYLKEGQVGLTRDSVHERQQLINDAPGLVESIPILLATYKRDNIGRLVYRAGLSVYDLLALQWSHKYYNPVEFQLMAPHIETEGLKGGFQYNDAQTDDARLVLRLIFEGIEAGQGRAAALNYAAVTGLIKEADGTVSGVNLTDQETGESRQLHALVVVNATGTWVDQLRQEVSGQAKIRPLRGSHLVFPGWRLPVAQVVTFLHPIDLRPVMIFPWEGATLVGTTDLDHSDDLDSEPHISPVEVAYLMAAVDSEFPSLNLTLDDVIGSFAGVRPVIGTGKLDPSEESRDHEIMIEKGLVTITGGKLTTFRLIALETLKTIKERLPTMRPIDEKAAIFERPSLNLAENQALDDDDGRRLSGRYGREAAAVIQAAQDDELKRIPNTQSLWAELRWAARAEAVCHLDDLLLRRVRIGLILPEGGAEHLPRIRTICQPELGWDDKRWAEEEANYLQLWHCCYSLPAKDLIPDWQEALKQALDQKPTREKHFSPQPLSWILILILSFLGIILLWRFLRRAGDKA